MFLPHNDLETVMTLMPRDVWSPERRFIGLFEHVFAAAE